jgi:hypothetical protein
MAMIGAKRCEVPVAPLTVCAFSLAGEICRPVILATWVRHPGIARSSSTNAARAITSPRGYLGSRACGITWPRGDLGSHALRHQPGRGGSSSGRVGVQARGTTTRASGRVGVQARGITQAAPRCLASDACVTRRRCLRSKRSRHHAGIARCLRSTRRNHPGFVAISETTLRHRRADHPSPERTVAVPCRRHSSRDPAAHEPPHHNPRCIVCDDVALDTRPDIKKRRSRIPGGTGIAFDRRSAARRRGDTFRGATVLTSFSCEGRANAKPKLFDGFSPDIASFHCRLAIARLQLRKRLEHCECARRVVGWSPNTFTGAHVAFEWVSPTGLSGL